VELSLNLPVGNAENHGVPVVVMPESQSQSLSPEPADSVPLGARVV
jgi:hypothetical protein